LAFDKVLIVKDIWVSAKETASRFIVLETIESDEDRRLQLEWFIFLILFDGIIWENICRKKNSKIINVNARDTKEQEQINEK
jgi:hypothetical protein